jgi:hypothetical protein
MHKTASNAAATRLATSRPAGSNHGGSSSSGATPWVSAAEVLRLMQDYSTALSALNADLIRARQRAEEVTALKLTLDKLRTQQQHQMHPQKPAAVLAKHPLLLGQQQQQQQQQRKAVGAGAAAGAGSNSTAAGGLSPDSWAQQRRERNHVRIFIGVYVSAPTAAGDKLCVPHERVDSNECMCRRTSFVFNPKGST